MTHHDRPKTGITLTRLPELDEPYDFPNAGAFAPDGTLYVVCTEGVGWKPDDKFPGKDRTYTYDEIAELVRDTDHHETVQLEDWVRQFGARLENNFNLWHRTLKGDLR